MKIEVRPLRDTDIEELSRIEAASFSMPWSAEDFRGLLLRDYCLYVVAEADGHIAGCAGLTDSFHEGNIDNVVTAPEYPLSVIGCGSKGKWNFHSFCDLLSVYRHAVSQKDHFTTGGTCLQSLGDG